jgi:predicted acetyltransferase
MGDVSYTIKEALPGDRDILMNLYSLYGHDISEFTSGSNVNERGLFEFEDVDEFLHGESVNDVSLKAYIILIGDRPAGFLLLGSGEYALEGCNFIIYDLFIIRKYRKMGIASGVMREVFSHNPGKYCVSDIESNIAAVNFWRGLTKQHDPDCTEESFITPDDEKFLCQIFQV